MKGEDICNKILCFYYLIFVLNLKYLIFLQVGIYFKDNLMFGNVVYRENEI